MSNKQYIGLWPGEGTNFKHGKPVEINGSKFWVNLYTKERKSESSPVYDLCLTPVKEQASNAPF